MHPAPPVNPALPGKSPHVSTRLILFGVCLFVLHKIVVKIHFFIICIHPVLMYASVQRLNNLFLDRYYQKHFQNGCREYFSEFDRFEKM